jgi:hypothetical protein
MRWLGWSALIVLAAGCDKVEHLRLPDPTPEAELAFAVLYDGAEPAVVGPVVRRQAVYAGRYSLAGGGGLEPHLYFLRQADVTAAAEAACGAEAVAADRVLCLERVAACADTPEACWSAARTTEGCGARLPLGDQLPVETFRPEGDRLTRAPETTAAAVSLCGPPAELACPNRRAGYAVFSEGKLACVPEVRQLDCALTLDLAACGLPRLEVALDEAGRPTLAGDDLGCAVASAGGPSGPFGAPADFALVCAGQTFDLYAQDSLLAEAQCPRRGPGAYETEGRNTGRITGAMVLTQSGARRLVMAGGGDDDCAANGCSVRGSSCSEACFDLCLTQVAPGPCARDSWAACAPLDESDSCQLRCQQYCARPTDDDTCYADATGQTLTTSAPEQPEVDRFRADLDGDGTRLAAGQPTLAPLVGEWLGVATRRRLYAYGARDADGWDRKATLTTPAELGGVLAPTPDSLAYFGRRDGVVEVARVEVTRGAAPTLTPDAPIALPALRGAELGALGGRRGDWLFVAATQVALSDPPPRQVQAAALESGVALPPVELPGEVTALLGLPGGDVLVAYLRDGDAAEVAVLVPGAGQVDAVHPRPIFAGVRVSALALEPTTCGGSAPAACRVFMALEPTGGAQSALLGALLYDAAAPASLKLQAGLRSVGLQSVSLLAPDPEGGQVFAVAGGRNTLVPMRLLD